MQHILNHEPTPVVKKQVQELRQHEYRWHELDKHNFQTKVFEAYEKNWPIEVKVRQNRSNISDIFNQNPNRSVTPDNFLGQTKRRSQLQRDQNREMVYGAQNADSKDFQRSQRAKTPDFNPKYNEMKTFDRKQVEIYGRDILGNKHFDDNKPQLKQRVQKTPLQIKNENMASNVFAPEKENLKIPEGMKIQRPNKTNENTHPVNAKWTEVCFMKGIDVGYDFDVKTDVITENRSFNRKQMEIASIQFQNAWLKENKSHSDLYVNPQTVKIINHNRINDRKQRDFRYMNRNFSNFNGRLEDLHQKPVKKPNNVSSKSLFSQQVLADELKVEKNYARKKTDINDFPIIHPIKEGYDPLIGQSQNKSGVFFHVDVPHVPDQEPQEKSFVINVTKEKFDETKINKMARQTGLHIVKIIPEINTINNEPTGKAEVFIRTVDPKKDVAQFRNKMMELDIGDSQQKVHSRRNQTLYAETSNLKWNNTHFVQSSLQMKNTKLSYHDRTQAENKEHEKVIQNQEIVQRDIDYENDHLNQLRRNVSANNLKRCEVFRPFGGTKRAITPKYGGGSVFKNPVPFK